jgi:two-component system sensor histidine kinase TctE
MNSIRLRLLKWLIGPILLFNLAAGALTYLLAWMPAQSAFDQGLGDSAGALVARLQTQAGRVQVDLPRQAEQVLRADAVDAIYFVVRRGDGTVVAGDADFPPFAVVPGQPAQALDATMRGEPVRLAAMAVTVGGAGVAQGGGEPVTIGVAKTLRKRLQIRGAIVRALILLEALFTAALVGLIWFSVTNGLRPLSLMRAELKGRDGDDLALSFQPLPDDGVPYELVPVVGAFNDLLAKVQDGARAQHDFLANVAHQLRTPLAGIKLQLEWLGARHAGDAETAGSLQLMLASTERMIRQSNQLLALARAEPSHFEKTRLEPLDLSQLVQESIQVFVDAAAKKQIDIGFELEPAGVVGEHFLLRDLIDNLVDNAIRYTPTKGVVTVRCGPGPDGVALVIEDSGPGIEPAKRMLVFNRRVRLDDKSSGSGLGLAIVRDIALAHGARISIGGHPNTSGVVFSVRFPHP